MTLTVTTRGSTSPAGTATDHSSVGREPAAAIVIPVSLTFVPARRGALVTALPWGWS